MVKAKNLGDTSVAFDALQLLVTWWYIGNGMPSGGTALGKASVPPIWGNSIHANADIVWHLHQRHSIG